MSGSSNGTPLEERDVVELCEPVVVGHGDLGTGGGTKDAVVEAAHQAAERPPDAPEAASPQPVDAHRDP
jgi:hypothetical protein